jgi:hypothetical protein
MSFGDETGDYSSIHTGNYQSVDSKVFDNKLTIEDTYAEIEQVDTAAPEYATVDMKKKRETRKEKLGQPSKTDIIYENIQTDQKPDPEDNIYELVSPEYTSVQSQNFYNEAYDDEDEVIYEELNN